jgi:uncharacterized protein
MQQRWHDLLFAHWRAPADRLRTMLPPPIELDTYQGEAWVSVVPFRMTGVRFRWAPPIPTAHAFPELNVRTYVTCNGHSGLWFFSLDAPSTLAVLGARAGAGLPYFRAAMRVTLRSQSIDYHSERLDPASTRAVFSATYAPLGSACVAMPGSLEFFLTERYALFARHQGHVIRIDARHPRWALYGANAAIRCNTVLQAAGLTPATDDAPLLHFATFQDVRFWPPQRVA